MEKSLEEWLSYVRSKGFKIVSFIRYDIEASFTDDEGNLRNPINAIDFKNSGTEVLLQLNDGGIRASRFAAIMDEFLADTITPE